jgi:hypothetical protein
MARFAPGEPIVSEEPVVVVDAGLPPGQYVFQLEVVNDLGEVSEPARALVTIVESDRTVLGEPSGGPTGPS